MEVIGAGLPRTGTASLTEALKILGHNKCMHMYEILVDVDLGKKWTKALSDRRHGIPVDWRDVTKGYTAGVDAPVCDVFEELAETFPKSKVILTYRDGREWIKSCQGTIMIVFKSWYGFLIYWVPALRQQRELDQDLSQKVWRANSRGTSHGAAHQGGQSEDRTRASSHISRTRRMGASLQVPRGPCPRRSLPSSQ